MIAFKKFVSLNEALTSDEAGVVKHWYRDPEAHKHTDHFFGPGNDDRIELLNDTAHKSEIHRQIEHHLGQQIEPHHYKAGVMLDKYNRIAKIGKALEKRSDPRSKELLNRFANDSSRQASRFSGLHVHTTRSAVGVAGQTSNGQSWYNESCKNFNTGGNKHYLQPEVEHGTVVSYLKDHTGRELARATFQPHINDEGHRAYALDSYYGIEHDAFKEHNRKTERDLSGTHKGGDLVYGIHPKVYNDSGLGVAIHPTAPKEMVKDIYHDKENRYNYDEQKAAVVHHNFDHEMLDHLMSSNSRVLKMEAADRNPNFTHEHFDKFVNHPDNDKYSMIFALNHPMFSGKHIPAMLDHYDTEVNIKAIKHKDFNPDHAQHVLNSNKTDLYNEILRKPFITKEKQMEIMNGKNHNAKVALMDNPSLHSDVLHRALDDDQPDYIKNRAIKHANIKTQHIQRAIQPKEGIDEDDDELKGYALQHPSANSSQLSYGLKSKNPDIREIVAGHKNISDEDLYNAITNDSAMSVKVAAVKNRKANHHHIDAGLNSKSFIVRQWAASHANASQANLHKAFNDEDEDVVSTAINHKNAQPDLLRRGMEHKKYKIRRDAYNHPNADFTVHAMASKDDLEKMGKAHKDFLATLGLD